MPMDGVMLGFVARELKEKLVGGRVDKVTQPEKDEIILTIRNQGENRMLLITANPGSARLHLTHEKKNNPLAGYRIFNNFEFGYAFTLFVRMAE